MSPLQPHLAAELWARMSEDQHIRMLPDSERPPDDLDQWRAIDADNTAALCRIIDESG